MVDISPESAIFGIFRNLSYKPWFALGEFVDNSIASWEKWNKECPKEFKPASVKVDIEINTSGAEPYIEIRDNATGIKLEDFDRAFKVASIPPDRTGLNEFGMGMKTAGFWFSNNWTVRTSFFGEGIARTMHFNLEKILSEKLSNVSPQESTSKPDGHFTTVRLMDLNQFPKGMTVGKIKRHLTSIYREFLRNGSLVLTYNGESLKFDEPAVLNVPPVGNPEASPVKWEKEINFHLENGRHVTGWVAIRETGSTKEAGLALFRKKRLILGSADEPYRPYEIFGASNAFRYQRIFGEIHFDASMGVTHQKDAFKWEEGEEEYFVEKLRQAVVEGDLNLWDQAEKYRVRDSRPDGKTVEDALDSAREELERFIPASIPVISPDQVHIDVEVPDLITVAADDYEDTKSVNLNIETQTHGTWKVVLSAISDEAMSNFFQVGAQKAVKNSEGKSVTQLDVQVNIAHPFAMKYLGPNLENSDFLFAFTSCLAISLALGKSVGARSNYIIDYVNDILRFGGGL